MNHRTNGIVGALVSLVLGASIAFAALPATAGLERDALAGLTFDRSGVVMPLSCPHAALSRLTFHWSTVAWGRNDALRPIGRRVVSRSCDHLTYEGPGLTEWYRTTPEGLEQGFDVQVRVPGAGSLVIAGARPSDLEVRATPDGAELLFRDQRSGASLRCAGLQAADALGRVLPSRFDVRASSLCIVVDDAQATYPIVIDPFYGPAQATISGYGSIVSTVGDVNGDGYGDVAVSDPYYTDGPYTECGRVSIFLGGPNGISTTPWWTSASDVPHANMGYPTFGGDFNGDGYGDVCMGGGLLSDLMAGSDWFVVYYGGPNSLRYGWTGLARDDFCGNNKFTSIANAGDINHDFKDEIVAGNGDFQATDCQNSGAIWTYHTGGGDNQLPDHEYRGDSANAWAPGLGRLVASAGDVDGDGWPDIVAISDFTYYGNPGAVVLTNTNDGGLNLRWLIHRNYNGGKTALAGDVNGDGYSDVVLNFGSTTDVYSGGPSFNPDGPNWVLNGSATSVFTAGDTDGNGCGDLVIGNANDNTYGNQAGIA